MRKPKTRGKPVNNDRMTGWLERFDGYRVALNEGRVSTWLRNFRSEDLDLAARVLDAVTFMKPEDMEQALREMAGDLPGWHKNKAKRQGKWRFVAFSVSAGESGDSMLHKTRTALGLTGKRYNELFIYKADLLREKLSVEDSVVFVDDFAGTGQQACGAWHEFDELLPGNPKTYLVVVAAGQRAVERIAGETKLKLFKKLVLGPSEDIFSTHCEHFTQAEKNGLLEYCKKADRKHPQGFGNCGFVLVLAHRTPNNTIPVLHARHEHWSGLFPRY